MNQKLKKLNVNSGYLSVPCHDAEDERLFPRLRIELRPLLKSLGVLVLATGIAAMLDSYFLENNNVSIIYTLAVAVVACITPGYIYGILASIVSVIGVNYFFTLPYFAFNFTRTGYPITFASLLVTSIIMSTLMARYRETARIARLREMRNKALYDLTNEFLAADGAESFREIACTHIARILGEQPCFTPAGKNAPEGVCQTLPVSVRGYDFGAISVPQAAEAAAARERVLLQQIVYQLALALERAQLQEAHRNARLQAEAEAMRGNLLRAVSHDLRTPLTSIQGASATILESGAQLGAEVSRQLVEDIHENAQWLIRMVENLLSVTRISDGPAAVRKEPEVVEEVVAQAVGQLRKRFPEQGISVRVPDDVLMIPMDATLIEQVLINLVENAFFHAGTDAPVEITVRDAQGDVAFTVRDHGAGIDPLRLETIFEGAGASPRDKSGDAHRGMGIGLSICRAIVQAHRGVIRARNAPDGGAIFEFTLPKEENGDEP